MNPDAPSLLKHRARHFLWSVDGKVGRIVLNRPERKNPLTLDSYAELRDLFGALTAEPEIAAIVISGADENFCSGGDVHDIIGPLTKMDMRGLLAFTRMTGGLVKGDARLPSTDRGCGGRSERRGGRDHRDGLGPAGVRFTWFITSRDEYYAQLSEVGVAYREVMGCCYPPMSVVQVAALMEKQAKVEIEATAVIPDTDA